MMTDELQHPSVKHEPSESTNNKENYDRNQEYGGEGNGYHENNGPNDEQMSYENGEKEIKTEPGEE